MTVHVSVENFTCYVNSVESTVYLMMLVTYAGKLGDQAVLRGLTPIAKPFKYLKYLECTLVMTNIVVECPVIFWFIHIIAN